MAVKPKFIALQSHCVTKHEVAVAVPSPLRGRGQLGDSTTRMG
jgi:hypothetical protein